MTKLDALQGSLDLLVLTILARRPRLHGYAIMSAIQGISDEVLKGSGWRKVRCIRCSAGWRRPDGFVRIG